MSEAPIRSSAQGVLPVMLFMAMELAWIAAIAFAGEALIAGTASAAGIVALSFYPVAWLAGRALPRLAVSDLMGSTILIGLFAAGAILLGWLTLHAADPPAGIAGIWDWLRGNSDAHRLILMLVVAVFCTLRGVILAARGLDTGGVAMGFQTGLIVLFALFLAIAGLGVAVPAGAILVSAFVVFGLLALWAVRSGEGGSGSPMAVILGVLAVVGLGGGMMLVADPSILNAILAALAWIGRRIAAFLDWLFPAPENYDDMIFAEPTPTPGPQGPGERTFAEPWQWLRVVYGIFFFGVLALMIGMILMNNLSALLRWLRGFKRTPDLSYDRSGQRFRGLRDFLAMLARAARAALLAFREAIKRWVARLKPAEREQPGASRYYRSALRRLRGRGWGRRPHETPREYALRLKPEWPGPGGELALMTRAFEEERYGARVRREGRLRTLFRKLRRSVNKVTYRNDDESTR
ncbi:MAG TPA: DUF4129 domain-containing protein [Saliniramus sp.]|nr:DUF4129 domain-containing protein [Saliniramus sp.]